jgi:hypothetical protein
MAYEPMYPGCFVALGGMRRGWRDREVGGGRDGKEKRREKGLELR